MKAQPFIEAVKQLSDDDFQLILEGNAIIIENDVALTTGRADSAYVIYELGEDPFTSSEEIKAFLIQNAEALLKEYYQFNPVSRQYFDRSLNKLFEEYGPDAFSATPDGEPERVLFVEDGELISEDASSPRFKYGMFMTIEDHIKPLARANKVKNWVQSGTAYGDYISVNVCRFSAME